MQLELTSISLVIVSDVFNTRSSCSYENSEKRKVTEEKGEMVLRNVIKEILKIPSRASNLVNSRRVYKT